jgi:hypothetical protein
MAQVVECLPSKCEALSSNPSTKKERKKEKRAQILFDSIYIKIRTRPDKTNGVKRQARSYSKNGAQKTFRGAGLALFLDLCTG